MRYHARLFTRVLSLTVLCAALLAPAGAPAIDAAWTNLLSLAAVWEGTEGGRTTTITCAVVSGGSALLESMKMPAPGMVTVYRRDGAGFVATHDCSLGNQPRMRSARAARR